MANIVDISSIILAIVLFLLHVKDSDAIQCYACVSEAVEWGDTCYYPDPAQTKSVECPRDAVCEKRIFRRYDPDISIERGCSVHCNGRGYAYTEQYSAYCCQNEDRCNYGNRLVLSSGTLCFLLAIHRLLI